MKIVKYIFKGLILILGLLVVSIGIVLIVDNQNTKYLNRENNVSAINDSYIISNVNIVPMYKDTLLFNKNVHIENGFIKNISDKIINKNIQIFDAQNQYITPGLIDMHVHVWDKYELGLYLSNGVTAVRNLWGMPMHLRMKEAINKNKIIAPLFFTTGPKLTGPEFIGDDNLNLLNPKEAKEKVISFKARGYDFIKTYYGLTPDIFEAVVEQSEVSDLDIIAHPSQKVPYAYHFQPQIKSIEHAEEIIQQPLNYQLDTVKLNEVIQNFIASKNSAFTPTLVVYHNIYEMLINEAILESEELQFMNPLIKMVDSKKQFDRWHNTKLRDASILETIKNQHKFHLKILKKLHDENVRIICGTDSGIGVTAPGSSIHTELAFYKKAGLSNYEVLKTATVNAAATHALMNNMGTIEVGKIANLVLVNNNPLNDLSVLQNPNTVFIKGKILNKETLELFNEKAKGRNNLIASVLRYLENLIIEK